MGCPQGLCWAMAEAWGPRGRRVTIEPSRTVVPLEPIATNDAVGRMEAGRLRRPRVTLEAIRFVSVLERTSRPKIWLWELGRLDNAARGRALPWRAR